MGTGFIHEIRAYELLTQVGLCIDRWGVVKEKGDVATLGFSPGQGIVIKGTATDVWHKSDLGLVQFDAFDADKVWAHHETMKAAASAHGQYIGTLVARKVDFKKLSGAPTEALVALRKTPEAGWTLVMGIGGILTNAWGEEIKPLLWPLALATPEEALADFKAHWLGRTWLGTMRQGKALTDEPKLRAFFQGLWKLADLLEAEGATLLEMNPMVLDEEGRPIALDGVGTTETALKPAIHPELKAAEVLEWLVRPRSIALAGISTKAGTPGRTILDNLLRGDLGRANIVPIKPNTPDIDGIPCLESVADLAQRPVDILILSLPAPQTVEAIEQLCAQGGGAQILYLVPGGIGDGADKEGLGKRVQALLAERRSKGLWTPLLIGPNGLGFLCAERRLNTLFLPEHKLPTVLPGGPLALVSQSGAFLVSRLSASPFLPMAYACSIGNQMDLRLSDFLKALGQDARLKVLATYVEGFQPGDLLAFARAARELTAQGKRVVMYKGGRSQAGMAAASSHTGALAGDWELQKALLRRAGVIVCEALADFDAVLTWLASYPEGRPHKVAVVTNAGFESVVSADLVEAPLCAAKLSHDEEARLAAMLEAQQLSNLVSAHLPLDLTPMASETPYFEGTKLLAQGEADSVVVGLVPLTQRLNTTDPAAMVAFAQSLRKLALDTSTRVGVTVDAGSMFEPYREAMMKAGLPVFATMERALVGLRLLAERG
ncbi:MAG: acetate--CoA ligase family protein [Firmicutes bacterium]|nr:acetate--CoA ligase family protein [Bacillota bacterium]